METTLAILKPDTVAAGNAGRVLAHLEGAGFALRGLRVRNAAGWRCSSTTITTPGERTAWARATVCAGSSTPGIGTHNLCIEAGTETPEAILAKVDRGFYYDDQGSFGFNPVTGDYSFQAQGYWIERGEIVHPVDGVTVAGNSLEMLRGIASVRNDLVWKSSVAAPTLLISEMTVSGS